jgi:hypothetical protein
VHFIEGDFLNQPDMGTFDLIVMIRVLTCFSQAEDWHAVLNRGFGSLASEGLIYVHDFVIKPRHESYRTLARSDNNSATVSFSRLLR